MATTITAADAVPHPSVPSTVQLTAADNAHLELNAPQKLISDCCIMEGVVRPRCVRIRVPSILWQFVKETYLEKMMGILVVYVPGTEEPKGLVSNRDVPAFVYELTPEQGGGRVVEVPQNTVRRAFAAVGVAVDPFDTSAPAVSLTAPSTKSMEAVTAAIPPVATPGESVHTSKFEIKYDSQQQALTGNRAPQNPDEWMRSARFICPDADNIRKFSPRYASFLAKSIVTEDKSEEQIFFEWLQRENDAFLKIEDVVQVRQRAVLANTETISGGRHEFEGGVVPVGISGNGVAYVVGRESRERPYRLCAIAVHDESRPLCSGIRTEKLPDIDTDASTGKSLKDAVFVSREQRVFNIDEVWPCWQPVQIYTEQYNTVWRDSPKSGLRFSTEPVMSAVSSQVSKEGRGCCCCTVAMIVSRGVNDTSTDGAMYDLHAVYNVGRPGSFHDVVPLPSKVCLPTLMAVSLEWIALLYTDAKDPTGKPYDPHLLLLKLDKQHNEKSFTIERGNPLVVLVQSPTCEGDAVPKAAMAPEVAKHPFTAMAFDETDSNALLIGTHDGGCMRLVMQAPDEKKEAGMAVEDSHTTAVWDEEAVYLHYTTDQEIAIANQYEANPAEASKRLSRIGGLRCPVWWIQASDTAHQSHSTRLQQQEETATTTNIEDKIKPRIVATFALGFAWALGDRTKLAYEMLHVRKMRAFETRQTGAAHLCAASRGSVALLQHMERDRITFIDMRTGAKIGELDDPSNRQGRRPNEVVKVSERAFSSLWCDVGRAVVLYDSGELSFIARASPEVLAARDKAEAEARELRQRLHDAEMRKLQEATDRLSLNNAPTTKNVATITAAAVVVAAATTTDAPMKTD